MTELMFATGLLLQPATSIEAMRRYTVCEVLADLPRKNEQILTIEGILTSGPGLWLRGSGCSQHIRVGERAFDDLLSLEWPDEEFVKRELKNKILFPRDIDGDKLVQDAVVKYPPGAEFRVIIEGMVVTRLPLSRLVHPMSPSTALGFGHLGIAPAMVVVKRVVKIVPP